VPMMMMMMMMMMMNSIHICFVGVCGIICLMCPLFRPCVTGTHCNATYKQITYISLRVSL